MEVKLFEAPTLGELEKAANEWLSSPIRQGRIRVTASTLGNYRDADGGNVHTLSLICTSTAMAAAATGR